MDAFTQFYGRNARLPGPLARGGAEGVVPGELAPPPDRGPYAGSEAPFVSALGGNWEGSMHPSGLVWAGGVDGYAYGSSQAWEHEVAEADLTGIQAMQPAGEWASAGGADAWRSYWSTRDNSSALAAVEGVSTAPGFGALFASTECLRYANGVCAMHGAPILPSSLADEYNIGVVAPGLVSSGRVERCGCGSPKTKLLATNEL
jgi:hypothetical protein